MEEGGCLWCKYEDTNQMLEIDKDLSRIFDDEYESELSLNSNQTECCICFEFINKDKNNCITECGHSFCLKCLATSMYHDRWCCPYCRTDLVDKRDDEDDDSDSEDGSWHNVYEPGELYDSDDDDDEEEGFHLDRLFSLDGLNTESFYLDRLFREEDDDDDDSEYSEISMHRLVSNGVNEVRRYNRRREREEGEVDEYDTDDDVEDDITENEELLYTKEASIEVLAARLRDKGFTMEDVLSMLVGRYRDGEEEQQIMDKETEFDKIILEADREKYEQEMLAREDSRDPPSPTEFVQ